VAAAESIGIAPDAFVAPAWLFNAALAPALAATGLRYTENHQHVIDIRSGIARPCPVITWATRTFARRAGSLVVCPTLLRLWRRAPAIRIALHPLDFDHPKTIDSITRVLDVALAVRQCVGHEDLFR
jgi:predicted deacetylase